MTPELLQLMSAIGSQIGQYLERKRAEGALQSSEELHRTISETASDAILMMNEQSIILSIIALPNNSSAIPRGNDRPIMTMLMPSGSAHACAASSTF